MHSLKLAANIQIAQIWIYQSTNRRKNALLLNFDSLYFPRPKRKGGEKTMIYVASSFFAIFVITRISQFIDDSMCGFDFEGEQNLE